MYRLLAGNGRCVITLDVVFSQSDIGGQLAAEWMIPDDEYTAVLMHHAKQRA